MEKNKLADIERNLKAALLRHAETMTQRDEAAASLRKESTRKATLEAKRAELLKRPFGAADKLAEVEIQIGDLDDAIAGHRASLRSAQPLIAAAAVEVAALRSEARQALTSVLEPLRAEHVAAFEAAAAALVNAAASIAAVEQLRGGPGSWLGELKIPHPVSGSELSHRTPPEIDDIKARLASWKTVAQLVRNAASVAASVEPPAKPEGEAVAAVA
jgi:hypothetical protein